MRNNRLLSLFLALVMLAGLMTAFGVMAGAANTFSTTLSGTVTITPSSPRAGDMLSANLSGVVANISASKLQYHWEWTTTGFTYITSPIKEKTFTTTKDDSGKRFRLKITADGYDGTLYSNTVTVGSGPSYEKGDVDRSGQVSNSDLIMVARHVVHIVTMTGDQFTLGDMDNDGKITNTDIITLARKIVGLS